MDQAVTLCPWKQYLHSYCFYTLSYEYYSLSSSSFIQHYIEVRPWYVSALNMRSTKRVSACDFIGPYMIIIYQIWNFKTNLTIFYIVTHGSLFFDSFVHFQSVYFILTVFFTLTFFPQTIYCLFPPHNHIDSFLAPFIYFKHIVLSSMNFLILITSANGVGGGFVFNTVCMFVWLLIA